MNELFWKIIYSIVGSIAGFIVLVFLLKRFIKRLLDVELDTAFFKFKLQQDQATKHRMQMLQEGADKIIKDENLPVAAKISITNMITKEIEILKNSLHFDLHTKYDIPKPPKENV